MPPPALACAWPVAVCGDVSWQVLERLPAMRTLKLGKAMASAAEFADEGGAAAVGADGRAVGYAAIPTTLAGRLALVGLLERHSGLTEVDLFNCDLADDAAIAIAKVREGHTHARGGEGRRLSVGWQHFF